MRWVHAATIFPLFLYFIILFSKRLSNIYTYIIALVIFMLSYSTLFTLILSLSAVANARYDYHAMIFSSWCFKIFSLFYKNLTFCCAVFSHWSLLYFRLHAQLIFHRICFSMCICMQHFYLGFVEFVCFLFHIM